MWIPILLVLFTFTSVKADIENDLENCAKIIDLEDEENLPEDLDEICPPILGLFSCAEKAIYKETGLTLEQIASLMQGDRAAELITVGLNVRDLFKDLCDHDSDLHKEYQEDAKCFKTIETQGENSECKREAQQAISMYEEMYSSVEGEPSKADRDCMDLAFVVACTAAQVKVKCGDRAFNTFRKIMKRTTLFKYGVCSEEQMENLKNFATDHLEVGEDRDLIQLAFDLRKRRK